MKKVNSAPEVRPSIKFFRGFSGSFFFLSFCSCSNCTINLCRPDLTLVEKTRDRHLCKTFDNFLEFGRLTMFLERNGLVRVGKGRDEEEEIFQRSRQTGRELGGWLP